MGSGREVVLAPLPRPRRRGKMDGIVKRVALAVLLLAVVGVSAYGDDAGEDSYVPHLFGLARHWKARHSSRIQPMLLAVDTSRPLPKAKAKPGSFRPHGPWGIPVTDVLEITETDDFPAALAAFEKRLDDPAAKHEDFVVEHSWIGTGNSDARLFAPAIERVRGRRIVFAWGSRRGVEGGTYHLDYDHHRGGDLGVPLIGVAKLDLQDFVRDVRLYLELLSVERISAALWRRLRAIPHGEIRYAAVRDVLNASYRVRLHRAPTPTRAAFARRLREAAGDSPRRRLQALIFHRSDPAPEVAAELLGKDHRWLVALVARGDPLADHVLGVASSRGGAAVAEAVGVDIVLAAIESPRGLPRQIPGAIRILSVAPVRRIPLERVRSIFRALVGDGPTWWSNRASNGHATQLLLALTRVLPDLVDLFPRLPEAEREAVRKWLRAFRVWTPSLEEPILKARKLFGIRDLTR